MERNFLMTVSHELRTPLTAIRGHVSALSEGVIDDRELARQSLEVIADAAGRLERLVGDVLDLAKLDAHRFTLLEEEVEMERLCEQAYSSFAEEARRRGIAYRQEIGARPTIQTDGDRVLQIITNLLSNAFRWTPDGGRIELELAAENGSVSVAVRDTGPGIDAVGPGADLPPVLVARRLGHRPRPRDRQRARERARRPHRAGEHRRARQQLHARAARRARVAFRRGDDSSQDATDGLARRAAAEAVDEEPPRLRRDHLRRRARRPAAAGRGARRVRRLLRRLVGGVSPQRRAGRRARPAPPDQAPPSGGERPRRTPRAALVAAGVLAARRVRDRGLARALVGRSCSWPSSRSSSRTRSGSSTSC